MKVAMLQGRKLMVKRRAAYPTRCLPTAQSFLLLLPGEDVPATEVIRLPQVGFSAKLHYQQTWNEILRHCETAYNFEFAREGEVSVEVPTQALPLAVLLAVEVSVAWQAFRNSKEEMFFRGCARMTLCILH